MAGRIAYYGNIKVEGLALNLDAAIKGSYPGAGTIWNDISGNNNNGILVNGPAFTGSNYGAIAFDGTDDHGYIDNSSFFTENFSSEVVISVPATLNNQAGYYFAGVFGLFGTDNYYREGFQVGHSAPPTETFGMSYSFLESNGGANRDSISFGTFSFSNTKIIATYTQAGNTAKAYINGSPVNTKVLSKPPRPSTGVRTEIGWVHNDANYGDFKGSIYGIKAYTLTLSPQEVFQNFNAVKGRYGIPDIVTDGLVLNLDAGNPYSYLSGSSGTTWTDVSGNGNNGTLTNGASYENGAIVFDGVDDYTLISSFTSLGNNPSYTMEAVLKFGNLSLGGGTDAGIIWYGANGVFYGAASLDQKGSKFCSLHYGDDIIFTNFSPVVDVIYHAVMTYDNSTRVVDLYVNGSFIQSGTHSNDLNITSQVAYVGGGPRPWNGTVYTAKIYNKVLSSTEIQQNFNALRGRYGL